MVIFIEFLITDDSFGFNGYEDEVIRWSKNKYKTWYDFALKNKDLKEFSSDSELLFYNISFYFHNLIASKRDVEFLREKVSVDFNFDEFIDKVFVGRLLRFKKFVSEVWLNKQFLELFKFFKNEISKYSGSVLDYYRNFGFEFPVPDRIFFHLAEVKNNSLYPFAFMASYSELEDGKIVHRPLSYALVKYKDSEEKVLNLISTIVKIAKKSDLLRNLLETGELFHAVYFNEGEAYKFLTELELYEKNGIRARVPNWWRKSNRKVGFNMRVDDSSHFTKDAIVSLAPEFSIGDNHFSKEELLSFLKESEGLRLFKGSWVEINHERIKSVLDAYLGINDLTKDGLNLKDILNLSKENPEYFDLDEVFTFFKNKFNKGVKKKRSLPKTFNADLRKYQEDGRNWLLQMSDINMGAILADDMGLGKTIQVLSYLETLRHFNAEFKVLIVVPTSLIANWEEEIKKFTPNMPYSIYHGKEKVIGECLTLTSYGTIIRDENLFSNKWDVVILDEAQAIKNPSTKQSKLIKRLDANVRICMTGTPIENDLMDLYSIFDFIEPGYLGTVSEFKKYSKELMTDENGYEKLSRAVSPFILRRLKTDKSIIEDLPQKIECKEYIDLAPKQVTLYKSVVNNFKKSLSELSGMERKGIVLSTINSLKQILNHPSQYSGKSEYKSSDSGKFIRLKELVKEIYDRRERVLIFTQYKEIIPHLVRFLEEELGDVRGLSLDGDTPAKERQKLVKKFNGDKYYPFMILSLKAGGVGLNLTGANHIIHFDRWWNPQTERQATDRAYRIGQKKDVIVHYFICRQTLDMSLDELLEKKKMLSDKIVNENKSISLTEMTDEELRDFIELRKE